MASKDSLRSSSSEGSLEDGSYSYSSEQSVVESEYEDPLAEPRVCRWFCCGLRTALRFVAIVETLLVAFSLYIVALGVARGHFLVVALLGFVLFDVICVLQLFRALKTNATRSLVPFLVWKPIAVLVLATLIALNGFRSAWRFDASAENVEEEFGALGVFRSAPDQRAYHYLTAQVLALAAYIVVECLFQYIVHTCYTWFQLLNTPWTMLPAAPIIQVSPCGSHLTFAKTRSTV